MTDPLPKISIVTPSFNQARFLDETILSVLDQAYPNLEYAVVDGGSSDGGTEIIGRYRDRLTWSCSEADGGQYDALNKGFEKTSGEIMGWLNSDDKYLPWTLSVVADIFRQFPEIEWLTTLYPMVWNEAGLAVRCTKRGPFSSRAFFEGDNLPGPGRFTTGWIQQESTFWRRSLWERAGSGLDASLKYAGDYDLWTRFFKCAELYAADVPLGGFRRHGDQKTAREPDAYRDEAERVLRSHGGRLDGRLASGFKLGLKRSCPNRLRPLAGQLGLIRLGKTCVFDTKIGRWRVVSG